MATYDWTGTDIIPNGSGSAVRADLNDALLALFSQNSSATAPPETVAYMPWADTATGLYKIRNAANSGWITLYQLDGEWTTIALENGTAAAPSLYFKDSGTDTGIYSPGTDQVAIATAGVQRVNFNGATEIVFNDGGADVDFRIEGDTKANLFKVDAGTDTVSVDGDFTVIDKIIHEGDTNTAIRFPANDVFAVETGGVERYRASNDGFLVNDTALRDLTGQSFQVTGWGMFYQTASGTTASAFTHTGSGTQSVCIFRQGAPASTVGSITVSGGTSTAFNTSSDYRLKENVAAITDGITRLQQLKPSRFNFIANPNHTVDGFIAHEVQDVVPEAITGEKDAVDDEGNPVYQGIDQSKLVPLLVAALQESVLRIETLEVKIKDLEA